MSQITLNEALILGIIQGLTEFLPISSSGHLVIFQNLLGLKEPQLLFDVVVHLGTLFAIMFVYRKDLLDIVKELFGVGKDIREHEAFKTIWANRPYLRLVVFIIIATLPAVIVGLLFQDAVEHLFGSLPSTGVMLLITGTFLFLTQKAKNQEKEMKDLTVRICLMIGIAQACALLPGISRSGITISTALFCGLNRDLAARFSFLLSIPAILGAAFLEFLKIYGNMGSNNGMALFFGGLSAFVIGYVALIILLRMVHQGRLFYFSYYCWPLGAAVLILSQL